MRYHLIHFKMAIVKMITSVGEDVDKRESCTLLLGMWICADIM